MIKKLLDLNNINILYIKWIIKNIIIIFLIV